MTPSVFEERLSAIARLPSVVAGVVAALLVFYFLTELLFQGMELTWLPWIVVGAIVAAASMMATRTHAKHEPIFLVFFVLTFVALAGWAGFVAVTAANNASETAAGRPYCLQVADGSGDYRRARAVVDLTALTMWATSGGPGRLQFHAVMAVRNGNDLELFNWSYRAREWRSLKTSGDSRTPVIRCPPQVEFARRLPLLGAWIAKTMPRARFFGRRAFAIPPAYRAKLTFATAQNLSFFARAPEFPPIERCKTTLDCINDGVGVYFKPKSILSWVEPSERSVVSQTDNRNGRRTNISCGLPHEPSEFCGHVFVDDGVLFRFSHRKADLPQWREMKEKLIALFRSFQQAAPAH